jgi:glucokinase
MAMPSERVVGVDVGGTKILVGLVDHEGSVSRSERYPMDRSTPESSLHSIEVALDAFLSGELGVAPLAVGFGVVGQTDPATATWVRATNIPVPVSVDMRERFTARHGLPAAIDNDVHAATLAELAWGAGRGAQDFIYLNVGTGIAAGIVTNGQLVRGAANFAGEFGHTAVAGDDVACSCGRRGCVEPAASGGGLSERARLLLPDYPNSMLVEARGAGVLNSHTIFVAADAGDPLACRLATDAVDALGKALVNLINVLNPEVIVVGGGVFGDGWLLPRLRARVEREALPAVRRSLRAFDPSTLQPDMVGLLGAAILAWERIGQTQQRRVENIE